MATPTLQIYAAIGHNAATGTGLSAASFGAALALAEASGEKRVAVRINSGGGNWQEGQTMYDLLKASALKVDTYAVGLVASAATLPFMAGTKRLIAAHAKLMIHECESGAVGGIADLENAINQQKAINHSMAQLYATATGQTVEKCEALMAATTYMTAAEAVALGFATGIMPDTQAAQAPPASLPTASLHSYYATLLSAADMKNLLLPIMAAAGLTTLTAASPDADLATAVQAAFTDKEAAKKEAADATAALATATAALDAANKKIADMEEEEAKATAAAAETAVAAAVEAAISSGRILAGQKEKYTALAKLDLGAVTAVFAEMPARKSVGDLNASIGANAGGTGTTPRLTAAGAMAEISAKARA